MGFFSEQKAKKEAQERKAVAEREAREKAILAQRVREEAKCQADQWLKIVNDCVELVNTTKNPQVFFMRYNLMLEHLEKLAGIECTGIFSNSRELPSEAFLRVEAQFPVATNDFIDRSLAAAKEKSETLKTEKGKINAIRRCFEELERHIIYMDAESIAYLDKLKEENNI